MVSTAIVWFRQDLRCHDNPALTAACARHTHVIPLYINASDNAYPMGQAQKWWLHHSLKALSVELSKIHLALCLRTGAPLVLLQEMISRHQVEAVYWNRCYEPHTIKRDQDIKSALKHQGIDVYSSNSHLLLEPWEVSNKSGGHFKVFTPFWKHCLDQIQVRAIENALDRSRTPKTVSEQLDDWRLLPKNPNWAEQFSRYWQPGEVGGLARLDYFLKNVLNGYQLTRNQPAVDGTSRLSPHLHFGEISPQFLWRAVQQSMQDPYCSSESVRVFLSEIGWREFSYHLLYHLPQIVDAPLKDAFNSFAWEDNEKAWLLWQKGLTGYPLVDAGMRELWQTGYMHNRVRMITASFLTKHLMIDWRRGASWFWDTLLDADLANNSASWQWVAGSGADAAPYYRIFNPVLQGERFDPDGVYVARWVPELSAVPKHWIHKPWLAPKNSLPIRLGEDYPYPVVDHIEARNRALATYNQILHKRDI